VGPGSLCTTRIETGCGVPQITALIDVVEMREEFGHFEHRGIISDGGIKNAGDCVKALALSDMVMIGNLFASTDEAPGEVDATGCFKRYVGSSTHKTSHVEGVKAWVKMTGPYKDTFKRLIDGITSGCSYNGVYSPHGLQYNPHFIKITAAGMAESYPHGVQIEPDRTK
jgi:IMP dehydrogenase